MPDPSRYGEKEGSVRERRIRKRVGRIGNTRTDMKQYCPRAVFLVRKQLRRHAICQLDAPPIPAEPVQDRPRTRGDCRLAPRPCPWVSCRYHLMICDTSVGARVNHSHIEVWEMRETCALDVADRGGATLQEIGTYLNLTKEYVRQVEMRALAKVREALADSETEAACTSNGHSR